MKKFACVTLLSALALIQTTSTLAAHPLATLVESIDQIIYSHFYLRNGWGLRAIEGPGKRGTFSFELRKDVNGLASDLKLFFPHLADSDFITIRLKHRPSRNAAGKTAENQNGTPVILEAFPSIRNNEIEGFITKELRAQQTQTLIERALRQAGISFEPMPTLQLNNDLQQLTYKTTFVLESAESVGRFLNEVDVLVRQIEVEGFDSIK